MVQDVAGRASAGAYIYKVDGDTLSLCWDRGPGAARPKKLESPAGSEVVLYVFKRVKAKE
jgi:hypothetical protein